MKLKFLTLLAALAVLLLAACGPAAENAPAEPPLLKTSMGDFEIVSARLVDQVNDSVAPPGDKFLLLELASPDGEKLVIGEFSLEDFQRMTEAGGEELYIAGEDGAPRFHNGMAGWPDQDEFVIGFTIFAPLPKSYTLHWPGNDPVTLTIAE